MARCPTAIEISPRQMRRLEQRLARLGDLIVPHASKEAAKEAGRDAQKLLQTAFRRHIEGGPAPATRIRPGSKASLVLVEEKPGSRDEVEFYLTLNRRAARWLQFQLGDRKQRRPGEVGVARKLNCVLQAASLERLGFKMPHGNTAKGTVERLGDATKRKKQRPRRLPSAPEGLFFGRPRGRGKRAAHGIWQRPADRDWAPKLLVAAVKQSRYKGNLPLQET